MLDIHIAPNRQQLGQQAAVAVAAAMRGLLAQQPQVRMIFAAAPSQSATLAALVEQPNIDWSRITAFHMDEYIGLPPAAPQRFGQWLRRTLFDRVPLAQYHLIEPGAGAHDDPENTCRAYAALLAEAPIDLCLLGIGANAHLAFNDPPADLDDPVPVKVVALDLACRQQQVDDQCFPALDDVPTHAITLTIPTLLAAGLLFASIPGSYKQQAVRAMLHHEIGGEVPATALRRHPNCAVYLDRESAALLS